MSFLLNVGEVIPSNEYPRIEWKISNFNAILRHVVNCEFNFYSPSFRCNNYTELMTIKLFLYRNDFDGEMWLQITVHPTGNLACTLPLINTRVKRHDGYVHSLRDYLGRRDYFVRCVSDLMELKSEIFPNGNVGFLVEFPPRTESSTNQQIIESPTYELVYESSPPEDTRSIDLEELSNNLREMYLKQQFCDLEIKVRCQTFKAHKSILCSRSTVFETMLQNDMSERNSNCLYLDDCSPEIFHEFLLYLYCGNIEISSYENILELYILSIKYDVGSLKTACVNSMKCNLSVDMFCDIVQLGIDHNDIELLRLSKEYFVNNAKPIMLSDTWPFFLRENSIFANGLLLSVVPDI